MKLPCCHRGRPLRKLFRDHCCPVIGEMFEDRSRAMKNEDEENLFSSFWELGGIRERERERNALNVLNIFNSVILCRLHLFHCQRRFVSHENFEKILIQMIKLIFKTLENKLTDWISVATLRKLNLFWQIYRFLNESDTNYNTLIIYFNVLKRLKIKYPLDSACKLCNKLINIS